MADASDLLVRCINAGSGASRVVGHSKEQEQSDQFEAKSLYTERAGKLSPKVALKVALQK